MGNITNTHEIRSFLRNKYLMVSVRCEINTLFHTFQPVSTAQSSTYLSPSSNLLIVHKIFGVKFCMFLNNLPVCTDWSRANYGSIL